jgi:hypothetical protein
VSASCTDLNSATTGNTGTFGTLAGNVLTIPASNVIPGSAISCVFTNATPRLTVQKISQGGTGTFSFTAKTNLASTPSSINTSTIGIAAPTTPTAINIPTIGTAVTVTEGTTAGYLLTAVNCTDENAAVTGNPASFGSFSGSVLTVPAVNVVAGAGINCVLTNTRTMVKVQKITRGGFGETFDFTQKNLSGNNTASFVAIPATITTAAEDVAFPVTPTPLFVTTVGTAVTITEIQQAAYYGLTSATCSDANQAATGNPASFGSISGNVLTVPATNIRAGADITCIFTNTKRATVRVQKMTQGGFGGAFGFSKTNLDTPIQSLTTTASGIAGTVSATSVNVTNLATDVTVTETPITGYALTSAVCSDVNSASSGNPASFGTFSSNTLTIPSTNIVAGADISCLFTNTRPNVSFQVQTIGDFGGPFNFSAASNLASTPSAITTIATSSPTPASPTTINITTVGTAVSITQTPPSGYNLTSVSCSDNNSAVTGKTGTFGTLSGNTLTILSTNIVAGASINCVFSNTANADYGDAPSSYGSAIHILPTTPTVYLGNLLPDSDTSGSVTTWQAQVTANGDDSNNTADEGAAQLRSNGSSSFPALTGTSYSLTLHCAGSGTVSGWVDFNNNGVFELSERAQTTCASGLASLNWTGLSGLAGSNLYARFRIASLASDVTNATGVASDGEVEDYRLGISVITLLLQKEVRNVTTPTSPVWKTSNTAKPNDVLEYRLTYTNNGGAAIDGTTLTIDDSTPTYTKFVSGLCETDVAATPSQLGTCRLIKNLNGQNVGTVQWTFVPSGSVPSPQLPIGGTGFVTYQVRVD